MTPPVIRRWHAAQLLQNLIPNAIKYRGKDTSYIVVSAQSVAKRLQVTVSDNSKGVPEKFRDRIFEPFRRINCWNAPQGTGLGLATCRKIALRHGGTV